MASNKMVSPGVFTKEIDQTQLQQGLSSVGGAIVGPFSRGPSFRPTIVSSQSDLQTLFGAPNGEYYTPYCAQHYLQEQGVVTIVRVGGLGGYHQKDPLLVVAKKGVTQRRFTSGTAQSYCFTGSISTGSLGYLNGGVSGFMAVKFASGALSGSIFEVGNISASFASGSVQEDSGSFISGSISTTLSGVSQFSGSLVSGIVFIASNGSIRFSGSIAGNYASFDPNSFDSSSFARSEDKLLAILANTAYDSGQNLWGFDGSTITPLTTSSLTLNYNLALKEVEWTEAANNSATSTSSYGSYDFSLDRTSPYFITNVFGTDPLQGTTIISGVKPKAAYVYKSFQKTIDIVSEELINNGSWKIEAINGDGLILNESVIDCVPDALIDPSQYITSYAMKFSDGIAGGSSEFDIRYASTPWILSQDTTPNENEEVRYELFRFHTLNEGTSANTDVKVEISNVKLAGTIPGSDYGSFDVVVRKYTDKDARPSILETFTNLTLDPNSSQFVARIIGDKYIYINGNGKIFEEGEFQNQSSYIRIEMSSISDSIPNTVVPYAFEAYATPVGGVYSENVPSMSYSIASTYSKNPGQYPSGVDFQGAPTGADSELVGLYSPANAYLDNEQYFAPIPLESTIGKNTAFSLDNTAGISAVYNAATERTKISQRRFVLGFQGGFDGQSPSVPVYLGNNITPTNQQGLDCSTLTSSGSVGYLQALTGLSNSDEYDINLIALPGINLEQHRPVAVETINMCENRGDCFYIMDLHSNQPAGGNSINNVVDQAATVDTNYAAGYYPWLKIIDSDTNRQVTVPPSVVLPAVYAQNDKVAAEWFAPAGLNRGGITQAVGVVDRLDFSERDVLYEGKVNPIASFTGQGITVWGQKTLQHIPSALDRINVRRLVINLKKFVASTSRFLVFEQNTATTRNRFLSITNPYLESVQQRQGLYAFKVVCDESNNTPDVIDRCILIGAIYIQPTRTAEFIEVPFVLEPTGATFPNS